MSRDVATIDIFIHERHDGGLTGDNESMTRETVRAMETTKRLSVICLALPQKAKKESWYGADGSESDAKACKRIM